MTRDVRSGPLVRRRTVLAAGSLAVVLGLSACAGLRLAEPGPFVTVERPVMSPSGAYRAVLVEKKDAAGTRLLVPTIQSAAGETVYSGEPYSARHRFGVMWQNKGDVLWVSSGDVGTSRIELVSGSWRKVQTLDGMPPEVKSAFGM